MPQSPTRDWPLACWTSHMTPRIEAPACRLPDLLAARRQPCLDERRSWGSPMGQQRRPPTGTPPTWTVPACSSASWILTSLSVTSRASSVVSTRAASNTPPQQRTLPRHCPSQDDAKVELHRESTFIFLHRLRFLEMLVQLWTTRRARPGPCGPGALTHALTDPRSAPCTPPRP